MIPTMTTTFHQHNIFEFLSKISLHETYCFSDHKMLYFESANFLHIACQCSILRRIVSNSEIGRFRIGICGQADNFIKNLR